MNEFQEAAERKAQWQREASEAAIFEGEPPAFVKADTAGMLPNRAGLCRFLAWKKVLAAEIAALESTLRVLQPTIDAPAAVKAKRAWLLQAQANKLLEFIGLGRTPERFDLVQRRALDDEVDSAEHHAEVGRIAQNDIAKQLAAKRLYLARLDERTPEYTRLALREEADVLGREYLQKIDELRPILKKLFGVKELVWGQVRNDAWVELPSFSLSSLADSKRARTIAVDDDDVRSWRAVVTEWGAA